MFPSALPGAVGESGTAAAEPAADVVRIKSEPEGSASREQGTTFILLDRGRTSGFQPIVPISDQPDLVSYHLVTYRQFKLRCRNEEDAASWAGRELRVSLLYYDDKTKVRHGTGIASRTQKDAEDLPLVLYTGGRKFVRMASVATKMDSTGTAISAFGITAASHRHAGRVFELLVEAPPESPPVEGRVAVVTRAHRTAGVGGGDRERDRWGSDPTSPTDGKRPRAESWGAPRSSAAPSSDEGESDGEPKRAAGPAVARRAATWQAGETPVISVVPFEGLDRALLQDADAASEGGSTMRAFLEGGHYYGMEETLDTLELNLRMNAGMSLQDGEPAGALPRLPRGSGPAPAPEALFWMTAEEARRQADAPQTVSPPLTLPAKEEEALWVAFCRLNDPVALESRANARSLVRVLLDPRTLASRLYSTLDGRYALRRAFHNLREAGAYPAVGVIVDAMVAAVCALPTALPDKATACAAVEIASRLLVAYTSEIVICSPDLAYVPWEATKRVLDYADVAGEAWRAADVEFHCRLLHRRALAFFQHGFTDAGIDLAFEAWSELIRAQATPSRIEAALLHCLVEMHLYAGRVKEVRRLAERLYYFGGGAPDDGFLEAQVHHALALVESALLRRPKAAIALATRAIAAYEGLPTEAYRHYVTRTVGLRTILYPLAGKMRSGGQEFRTMLKKMSSTHEMWATIWDNFFVLRYSWLHPPDVARELDGVFAPVKAMLRFMGIYVFLCPMMDRRLATPILGHALYQQGIAYLFLGMDAKAIDSLDRARAFFAERLPKHFPPESPRVRSIEAALREAQARLFERPASKAASRLQSEARGSPLPTPRPQEDIFGFAARRMPPAAALAARSALAAPSLDATAGPRRVSRPEAVDSPRGAPPDKPSAGCLLS